MISKRRNIWDAHRVNGHFPAQVRQLLVCDLHDMGFDIVVDKADGAVVWTLSLTSHTFQL